MSDFTSITLDMNTNTNASPTWTSVLGVNKSLRWHTNNAAGLSTAFTSWPSAVRSGSTAGVDYAYAYTNTSTGLGVLGSGAAPVAFSASDYLQARWNWDNTGTFASAPISTAYPTTSHGGITRGDGSILGGHATDTGGTAKSYIKGQGWGRVSSAGLPGAAPSNAPVVTDGTVGTVSPTAGANWLTNWQSMQGDNDYITFPATPAATTADQWPVMFRLFQGPNMNTGSHQPVITFKYTFS